MSVRTVQVVPIPSVKSLFGIGPIARVGATSSSRTASARSTSVGHILEVVGGQSLQHAINAAAIGGQIAIIGMIESNAATISISSILSKLVCLEGIAVGSREHMQNLLSFLVCCPRDNW